MLKLESILAAMLIFKYSMFIGDVNISFCNMDWEWLVLLDGGPILLGFELSVALVICLVHGS